MKVLRIAITRMLIRAAMFTCVMGVCHDYLSIALKWERNW